MTDTQQSIQIPTPKRALRPRGSHSFVWHPPDLLAASGEWNHLSPRETHRKQCGVDMVQGIPQLKQLLKTLEEAHLTDLVRAVIGGSPWELESLEVWTVVCHTVFSLPSQRFLKREASAGTTKEVCVSETSFCNYLFFLQNTIAFLTPLVIEAVRQRDVFLTEYPSAVAGLRTGFCFLQAKILPPTFCTPRPRLL